MTISAHDVGISQPEDSGKQLLRLQLHGYVGIYAALYAKAEQGAEGKEAGTIGVLAYEVRGALNDLMRDAGVRSFESGGWRAVAGPRMAGVSKVVAK